jgi:hypothetical protein
MVSIVNERAEPVIVFDQLPGCGGLSGTVTERLYFSVEGEARGRHLVTPPDTCPREWPSCEFVMRPEEPENSRRICAKPPAPRYIEASGRYETAWMGELLAQAALPSRCAASGQEETCFVSTNPAPGEYRMVVEGVAASRCVFTPCDELDELGSCLVGHTCSGPDAILGGGGCTFDPHLEGDTCTPSTLATAHYDGGCGPVELRIQG